MGEAGGRRRPVRLRRLLLAGLLVACGGCSELYLGAPSLTLLSVEPARGHYRPIGPVRTASDCRQSLLFLFGWGDPPSHEAVLSRMLAESGADVLLDAHLSTDRVSLLLFSRTCAVVRGQPARLLEAGA